MSVPQIPPRPVRAQQQKPTTMTASDVPLIPPRPAQRRTSERSQSPNRDHFPRSPFNEPPLGMSLGNRSGGIYGSGSQNASSSNLDLPQRPPSVSLPSIGQEGNEYADVDYKPDTKAIEQENGGTEPKETRNVGSDLPLHAPRPSFSNSTAKARVSTVTRTDSHQAAAAGIGKASTPQDDKDPHDRPLKPRVSFRTASSASTERPASAQAEDEHGIPEIGQRVPMYPDAGDVQAPSPSPFQQAFPAGVGFHNSGTQKPSKHHRRTPSGKEILPPGSYGMHGHGLPSSDHFEKSWYDKHPEALEREENGQYGPGIGGGRGEWALSSDDLNKLVRETSKSNPSTPGLPRDEIGWKASEEYASRLNTPLSGAFHKPLHSNHSQPHVESPLRKASFPAQDETDHGLAKHVSHTSSRFSSEHALESETEDDEVQMAPNVRKAGSRAHDFHTSTREAGSQVDSADEMREYEVPILAADEVARTPGAEYMQPAVSPSQERRGSYYSGHESDHQGGLGISRSGSASNSRPSSRPASIHSLPGLSRFSTHDEDRENMHTPLEDVDEYEPLFPDEDGNKERRPITAADRLKLREQMKRFPSKDIWEDTPDSAQLQASVDTPEPSTEQQPDPMLRTSAAIFETPAQESARKGEVSEVEKAKLVPREERLAKSNFKPHLRNEMGRPGLSQRFPSRDIWEDSPDSSRLETTVGETLVNDPTSPSDAGQEAGAIVNTSGAPNQGIIFGDQLRDNATVGAAAAIPTIPPRPGKDKATPEEISTQLPSVPARPPRRLHQVPPADAQVPIAPSKLTGSSPVEAKQPSPTDSRKVPNLPERPKPQVPARPAKPVGRESSETVPLSKITSASSVGSDGAGDRNIVPPPGAPKSKPAVPARPAGGKIASLKAGFLSDLDSRLKLGPQGPKPQEKPEPEIAEEKAPLADARKGRAKGPTRRKPVAPTAETALAAPESQAGNNAARDWQIQQPWTVWQHDGILRLGEHASTVSNVEPAALDDTKPTQAERSPLRMDGVEDTRDMEQAKAAVEESLAATDPSSKGTFKTLGRADLPSPTAEIANPLSQGPSNDPTPGSVSPATVISPLETHTENRIGEKTTSTDPVSEMMEAGQDITGEERQEVTEGSHAVSPKD